MTTNYDPIAEQYQRSKQQPWRIHLEAFSLLNRVGDLAGKSVLDVACGEGFYTRRLRKLGAERVVGIDLSAGMIELAARQEAEHQLGIEYRVGDARALPAAEFDIVVAAYLLNYARSAEELSAMCRGIAGSLRPGGRFVTVNANPACTFEPTTSYRAYGFEAQRQAPVAPGTPVRWTFFLPDSVFSIENYLLDAAAHTTCLREAGFAEVHWHAPQLDAAGSAEFGASFWQPFLDCSPIAILECVR